MSERDIEDQLKINDADGEVSPADRTEAGAKTGSESVDLTENNMGVLGDVAHPFDQTNGILDAYDETNPGTVSGDAPEEADRETPGEFAASATPEGAETPPANGGDDAPDSGDDTPIVPAAGPPMGR